MVFLEGSAPALPLLIGASRDAPSRIAEIFRRISKSDLEGRASARPKIFGAFRRCAIQDIVRG